MKKKIQVSIIGDSSSACIGDWKKLYPSLLYNSLKKNVNCELNNYSVPGFTSADAKYLFLSLIKKTSSDLIIIYLGNNESIFSSAKKKPHYFFWKINQKLFKRKNYYNYISDNKFDFTEKELNNSEFACTSEDFKNNIECIIKNKNKNTKILLINPLANMNFISGSGSANFEYFKIINFSDKVGNILRHTSEGSEKLINAISLQENEKFKEAEKIYIGLLNYKGKLNFVAKNNLAVIYSKKKPDLAKKMLHELVGEYKEYDSIIYYNLAELSDKNKEKSNYKRLAYQNDHTSYRIKNEYRNVINSISKKYEDVYCLDLKKCLSKKNFVDHCHPDLNGHKIISSKLLEIIFKLKITNDTSLEKNNFKNNLISPNYVDFPRINFVDYYKIEENYKEKYLNKYFQIFLSKLNYENELEIHFKNVNKQIDLKFLNFFKKNAAHPIFTKSLIKNFSILPHEICSFPENYTYKILTNYFNYFEVNFKSLKKNLKLQDLNSEIYKNIILRNNNLDLRTKLIFSSELQNEIEKKLLLFINRFDKKLFNNNIFNKLKTVMYWYTRESFRYGTFSRNSQMYEIAFLDKVLETLIILIVINSKTKKRDLKVYIKIIKKFFLLKKLHEKYTTNFRIKGEIDISYNHNINKKKKEILQSIKKKFSI